MKELLQTLYTELKYLKSQGQESVYVDESSMQILNKLIAKNASHSVKSNDFVKELTFVDKIDIKKIEEKSADKEIKVKSLQATDKKDMPSPKSFELRGESKEEKWESLRDIVLADKVCKEHTPEGSKLAFGIGNLNADIFFCGDAPSFDETEGVPFVGEAGQKLKDILRAMGVKAEDVYMANLVPWNPEVIMGAAKAPNSKEIAYCLPYLKAQIEIVKPKIIVALGLVATMGLLGAKTKPKMLEVRGSWQAYMGGELLITYHPSYLLKYATRLAKRQVWEDMLSIMRKLAMPISPKQEGYFL